MKELVASIRLRISTYTEVRKFLIIFFIIGFLGLSIAQTQPLFLKLTPYALLVNLFLLAFYHPISFDRKTIILFLAIYLISFIIEAVGVNSGVIFGNYVYGSGLGFKVYQTPLLIGLNWLFLLYASRSVVQSFRLNGFATVILASTIMVAYDIVLEQIAPLLDMWSWQNNTIPIRNYVAWFVISLFFHTLLASFNIKTANRLSKIILLYQFLFFVGLYIVSKITI